MHQTGLRFTSLTNAVPLKDHKFACKKCANEKLTSLMCIDAKWRTTSNGKRIRRGWWAHQSVSRCLCVCECVCVYMVFVCYTLPPSFLFFFLHKVHGIFIAYRVVWWWCRQFVEYVPYFIRALIKCILKRNGYAKNKLLKYTFGVSEWVSGTHSKMYIIFVYIFPHKHFDCYIIL